ncbi:MAG: GNAT family N-acetyltransferase [Saprospiraceae bacterium]
MKKFVLAETDLILNLSPKIESFAHVWDSVGSGGSFLDYAYLTSIEHAPPKGMGFLYVIIEQRDRAIAKLYFQILPFEADKSLKIEVPRLCDDFFESLASYTKKYIASKVKLTSLILGNMLLTGQHGFAFSEDFDPNAQQDIVSRVLQVLFKHPKLIQDASICLVKDFRQAKRLHFLENHNIVQLYEFQIQPGMRFYIRNSWHNLSDYLNDLNSKSRLRLRKAIESLGALKLEELTSEEMIQYKFQIHDLYKAVSENVGFNVLNLDIDYFSSVKSRVGDKFKIFAIKDKGHLIAFYSFVLNGDEMLAHFLGFEKKGNQREKVYTNILLNLIEQGIEHKISTIDFGRTALEIKSSVGAEEEKLFCYITHRSKLYNKFISKLLDFLKPEEPWIKRNPFKENA